MSFRDIDDVPAS